MEKIIYEIEFFSDWHCGSGLNAGADLDALCIKDINGLPFVPGKTIKGLLREAAELIFGKNSDFTEKCFGKETSKQENGNSPEQISKGACYFSNAELSGELQKSLKDDNKKKALLYRKLSSTAIEESGTAKEHSLRKIEVVVPLCLYGEITDIPTEAEREKLTKCLKYIKSLGINRKRGLGRCIIKEVEV